MPTSLIVPKSAHCLAAKLLCTQRLLKEIYTVLDKFAGHKTVCCLSNLCTGSGVHPIRGVQEESGADLGTRIHWQLWSPKIVNPRRRHLWWPSERPSLSQVVELGG